MVILPVLRLLNPEVEKLRYKFLLCKFSALRPDPQELAIVSSFIIIDLSERLKQTDPEEKKSYRR